MRRRKGPGALSRPVEPPNEVEVRACTVCGGVSLARYGLGAPRGDVDPCRPGFARPRGSGEGLAVLRYVRVYSAP